MVIEVKVMAQNQTLYEDALRVDVLAGASFTQSRSEASGVSCPARLYDSRVTMSPLHVRLSQRSYAEKEQAMAVDVLWTRPVPNPTCQSIGSRSATLSQTVKLTPGQMVRVDGDAGLKVEIRQR